MVESNWQINHSQKVDFVRSILKSTLGMIKHFLEIFEKHTNWGWFTSDVTFKTLTKILLTTGLLSL